MNKQSKQSISSSIDYKADGVEVNPAQDPLHWESQMSQQLPQQLIQAWQQHLHNLSGEPCFDLYSMTINLVEKELLKFAYGYCKGNLSLASKMLGISRTTFNRKLSLYGLR